MGALVPRIPTGLGYDQLRLVVGGAEAEDHGVDVGRVGFLGVERIVGGGVEAVA